MRFAAIDFETANHDRPSACAVGLVVVEGARVVDRLYELIRPPTRHFYFSYLHEITWEDVEHAPSFAEVWPDLGRVIRSVDFLAAHRAPFDRSMILSCCHAYGLAYPEKPFVCTVRVARQVWGIYPTTLVDVCARLGIPLRPHQADSDAEACARIVIKAARRGWVPLQAH